mgnify:CR=1 FL=1
MDILRRLFPGLIGVIFLWVVLTTVCCGDEGAPAFGPGENYVVGLVTNQ